MAKRLVIVESPAKARTIAGYLGKEFAVESSIGHIRDLPDRASDVPEAERTRFGALGVDVEKGFEPYYVVDAGKKKVVTELKKHLKDADELLLATDEDREGEAIAWHLVEVLKPKVPVRRMVFHEITEKRSRVRSRTRASSTSDSWTPRRRGGSSTGCTGTRCRRSCGRRSRAGSPPAGCSRSPHDSRSSASASASRSFPPSTGTSRQLRPGSVRGATLSVDGKRVAQGRDFAPDGDARREARPARRGRLHERSRNALAGRGVQRQEARGEAVPPTPGSSVQNRNAPARGEPQAPLLGADDDAGRPAPVRVRLHHVHANRLDDALGVGARGRARHRFASSSAATTCPRSRGVRASGRERPGGPRGDPAGRRHVPYS